MSINPLYHHTPERLNEEKVWVQRAKKSPENFGPLYKKYHEAIFRFVYQRMNDKDLAYDITSQIFIKAMNNIHRYEDKGFPFASWLYRIAKSEVYQSFRDNKTHRYVNVESIQIADMIEDPLMKGIEVEDNENAVQTMLHVLRKLKENEIQLIEMRYFEKRSYKEIGEILEITENNAKVKTFRIIEKIKKLYL